MIEKCVYHPCKSLWSLPLHTVTKFTGGICPIDEYRHLNGKTLPDHYPIPHLQDLFFSFFMTKLFFPNYVFSVHAIPVNEANIPKNSNKNSF